MVVRQTCSPSTSSKTALWETTVDHINKKAQTSFNYFTKPVFGQEPEPFAVVYYHRQLWVAVWLPRSKDDSYLYGLTIAYRDTAAARKQCTDTYIPSRRTLGKYMFNQLDESMMLPRIKDGRSYWYRKTILMTQDDIMDGYTGNYWKTPNRSERHLKSYGKTWHMCRAVQKWETNLLKIFLSLKTAEDQMRTSLLDLILRTISLKISCQATGPGPDGWVVRLNTSMM